MPSVSRISTARSRRKPHRRQRWRQPRREWIWLDIELSYARIYAPIDGLIGLTKAKPGEFVGREPNPVVLNTLSDIDPIRVRFSISEREYLTLARGEPVRTVDGR